MRGEQLAESESQEGLYQKRPIWLTKEQRRWLDHRVAERRYEVESALEPGQEMPQVSRSTIIREWIDSEIAKAAA